MKEVSIVVDILYNYATERQGSHAIVEKLIKKAMTFAKEPETIPASAVAKMIVSFNMTGQTDSPAFKSLAQHVHTIKSEFTPEEVAIVQSCGIEF
jgi:hypothetical protein